MIVQDDRGSLLTKGSLYNHFYRVDARHEISCRKARIFVSNLYNPAAYEWAWLNCYNSITALPDFYLCKEPVQLKTGSYFVYEKLLFYCIRIQIAKL